MIALLAILLALLAPQSNAEIIIDYNCTVFSSSVGANVYTPGAVSCDNVQSDTACMAMYKAEEGGYPTAGGTAGRPKMCYTSSTTTPITLDGGLESAAVAICPKTCGFCCMTSSYTCQNKAFPRYDCNKVTPTMCKNAAWLTILTEDCPATCGLCGQQSASGCVDAAPGCLPSLCNNNQLQDFVNANCQKTCGRCSLTATTTTASSGGSGTCTSYIPDSSSKCAAWARNGFCRNAFYKDSQRRAYCATTCKIC